MKKHLFPTLIVIAMVLVGFYFFAPQETVDKLLNKAKPAKTASKKGKKTKKKASKKKAQKAEKPAPPITFPETAEAREQAKAENKPFLIIWHGSDWMNDGNVIRQAWHELSSANTLPVIFGQFDEIDKLPDEARNKAALPLTVHNLPVAILFTPDGTFMACYDGKTVRSASAMRKGVKKALANMPRFIELVKQARESEGEASATAAGQALELLPQADAWRHRELVGLIDQRDPDDNTGYRSKFCYDHLDMYRIINGILKGGAEGQLNGNDRKFEDAIAYVQNVITRRNGTQPELFTEHKQQWLAGLYYIHKERMLGTEEKDRTEVLDTLSRIIELDPKSEYGIGAASYHRYWDPASVFTIEDCFYEPRHQTLGFEKDWHADITDKVDGPGTYTITLVPHFDGHLVTRNYRIAVNGKEVAQADIDPKQSTKTVDITLPSLPKGAKVELRLTAQCHDGWLGCSGRIEVRKQ